MLCSRFLKPLHSMKHGRIYNAIERMFDALAQELRLDAEADDPLQGARRWCVSALLLVGTVYLFRIVPKGFIPSVDTGQLNGRSSSRRASASRRRWRTDGPVMEILEADPERRVVTFNVGGLGRRPPERRPEAARRARARRPTRSSRSCGRSSRGAGRARRPVEPAGDPHRRRRWRSRRRRQYQFALQDPDTEELYRVAPEFEAALREMPGLQDVNSDLQLTHAAADRRSRSRADRRARADRRSGRSRRCRRRTARARSRRSSRPTTSTR